MIEFVERYFKKQVPEYIKLLLQRGRGSERTTNLAVMPESAPLGDLKSGKPIFERLVIASVYLYKQTI